MNWGRREPNSRHSSYLTGGKRRRKTTAKGTSKLREMSFPIVFGVFIGLFAIVECQRPLEGVTVSEIFPVWSAPNISRECGHLERENEMLRKEIESLRRKLEIVREIEDESESDESREPPRRNRHRRGVKCDAGTLAAWACAPQCVFKLKGLCGLSLKTICHC